MIFIGFAIEYFTKLPEILGVLYISFPQKINGGYIEFVIPFVILF